MLTDIEKTKLKKLGQRLKNARLEREDPQKKFAVRIGVSIPTLYKMEKGSPSITIGTWVKTLAILNKLDELDNLIIPHESLFERYETMKKIKHRQRAKRKKNNDQAYC
ncbi:MAG: helix-turn-helix transcriptional regulator [Thermodesulfobacteriota bacterium]|nr:helix-turn-helix transcriptional regulator [Thermodesulfobacteriota bacterium]